MFTRRLFIFKPVELLAAFLLLIGCAVSGQSQTGECRDEWPGHFVRSVKVKARWLPELTLPLKRGDAFTPDKLSETRLAVIAAIGAEKDRFNSEFIKLGKLQLADVNLVRACGRKLPAATCEAEGLTDKCVDVEVHPYALSTDPVFMGAILLPLPRSNAFSFLSNVPRPLRILNPKFGIAHDKELGVTPTLEISTDLLELSKQLKSEPTEAKRTTLLLKAKGSKSIGERFYTSQATLALSVRQPTEHIESLGVEASFAANQQPQRRARYLDNSFRLGGHLAFNPAAELVNRVILSAGYRRSNNRLFSNDATLAPMLTAENSYEGRALLEGRLFNGLTRLGLWFDGGKPDITSNSYGRVTGLMGYEKEIPIGEHTIGVETLFGLGRASRRAPEYALFYGGNSLNNFLYDEADDPSLAAMPAGPLLRSFGRNQAGFAVTGGRQRGANSFRHFNLTISVPLPGLSAPLIPNEVVNDSPRLTLRDLVEFAVNTGQEALSENLQDEGLSEDAADKKAAKVFGEIRPGVKYLTDYAKIYALKPLFMFDAARLTRFGEAGPQTRYAVGGGLQLTVVVAKFEAGYLHTVNRFEGDRRGNFILRLVFENLF